MIRSLLLSALLAVSAHGQATIQAYGELPADLRDARGDTIGGIGSGMVYDAKSGLYYATSDRGAGDGALPYTPRYVTLKIEQKGDQLIPQLVSSVLFRDQDKRPMTGLIPTDRDSEIPRLKDGRTCIDPEAIALAPDGTIYVTDEYGPYLYQFRRDGVMIRRIILSPEYFPRDARGRLDFTDRARLTSGRGINQGPEGMTLLPGGRTAALIFQTGLVQDGGRTAPNTRLLLIDLKSSQPTGLYLYPFARQIPGTDIAIKPGATSVNDLVALSSTQFLVLERDKLGHSGKKKIEPAQFKSVWQIDISGATNLLKFPNLDHPIPVKKSMVLNLAAIVPHPEKLGAKWETIALLAPPQGRRVSLLMAADNDFLTPTVYEDGKAYRFGRVTSPQPSQFYKISALLPQQP